MLANGVKETTTTTGTGTVTLTAVTGYPRFSSVFSDGAVISYAIRDGGNWEWGYGKLASNTLSRTPTAVFSGGVYLDISPSPLSLSGSAEVIATAHDASVDTCAPNGMAHMGAKKYLGNGMGYQCSLNSKAWSANTLYVAPLKVEMGGVVTKLGVTASQSVASATCRVGIYRPGIGSEAGVLIAESGELAPVTVNTDFVNTVSSFRLRAGWYFLALQTGGVAPTLYANYVGLGPPVIGGTDPGGKLMNGTCYWVQSRAYAALPSTLSNTGWSVQVRGNDTVIPAAVIEVQ